MSDNDHKKDAADSDDEVGNKRPPRRTQFKPGVSGNPNGRPKGSVNLRTRVVRQLRQHTTVNVKGRETRMLNADIVAVQIVDKAKRGDPKFSTLVLQLDDQEGAVEAKASTEETFELPNNENLRFIADRLRGLFPGDD